MLEPGISHLRQAVAGAEDDVNEILAGENLAQPVFEGRCRAVACLRACLQRARVIPGPNENVEIFRLAMDGGVTGEGITATNQNGDARLLEKIQHLAVKGLHFLRQFPRKRIGRLHNGFSCHGADTK